MEGGVTKEHAGCMRDGERDGEGMTLSSRQAEVFTQSRQTECVRVWACVRVSVCTSGLPSAQRYPDCKSVPVDQAKSLTLTAHSSSSTFLHSLSHSLALSLSLIISHAYSHTTFSHSTHECLLTSFLFSSPLFVLPLLFNILFMCSALYLHCTGLCRLDDCHVLSFLSSCLSFHIK